MSSNADTVGAGFIPALLCLSPIVFIPYCVYPLLCLSPPYCIYPPIVFIPALLCLSPPRASLFDRYLLKITALSEKLCKFAP